MSEGGVEPALKIERWSNTGRDGEGLLQLWMDAIVKWRYSVRLVLLMVVRVGP